MKSVMASDNKVCLLLWGLATKSLIFHLTNSTFIVQHMHVIISDIPT